jgi:hypothetical protein
MPVGGTSVDRRPMDGRVVGQQAAFPSAPAPKLGRARNSKAEGGRPLVISEAPGEAQMSYQRLKPHREAAFK